MEPLIGSFSSLQINKYGLTNIPILFSGVNSIECAEELVLVILRGDTRSAAPARGEHAVVGIAVFLRVAVEVSTRCYAYPPLGINGCQRAYARQQHNEDMWESHNKVTIDGEPLSFPMGKGKRLQYIFPLLCPRM